MRFVCAAATVVAVLAAVAVGCGKKAPLFPDCGDNVVNGEETDVDCGGPASARRATPASAAPSTRTAASIVCSGGRVRRGQLQRRHPQRQRERRRLRRPQLPGLRDRPARAPATTTAARACATARAVWRRAAATASATATSWPSTAAARARRATAADRCRADRRRRPTDAPAASLLVGRRARGASPSPPTADRAACSSRAPCGPTRTAARRRAIDSRIMLPPARALAVVASARSRPRAARTAPPRRRRRRRLVVEQLLADGPAVDAVLARLGPPAVEDRAVEHAVHRRLHARRAARLERPPRRVEPDVDAAGEQRARAPDRSWARTRRAPGYFFVSAHHLGAPAPARRSRADAPCRRRPAAAVPTSSSGAMRASSRKSSVARL